MSCPGVLSTMPMLTLGTTSCPCSMTGSWSAARIRSATATASRSSPTSSEQDRELVAAEPRDRVLDAQARLSRSAIVFSSWSPTSWPRLSLTTLKLSRSRNITADARLVAGGAAQRVLQPIQEQGAVRQAGQAVVERQPLQLGLGPLALADLAGQQRRSPAERSAVRSWTRCSS